MSDNTYSIEQLTFMEIMNILMRWKKTILLNVFYISLLIAVISLILPKTFIASAVLMPPSSQSDVSILNAFWAGMIYGYLRIRTNSLWPSIILHGLWNGHLEILEFFYFGA